MSVPDDLIEKYASRIAAWSQVAQINKEMAAEALCEFGEELEDKRLARIDENTKFCARALNGARMR